MSADDGGPGRREVAHRLFAAEFDDATVSYAESDEERAPKYVVTPTGARVNRLFAVGVLTEVESVNEDVLRARVVDPTGAFVTYAGQYQPDAAAFFERTDPPAFVALTGKARTFEPDDGDRIYSSVRPESVAEVDADTRDRWTVSTAEATLRRVAAMAEARSLDERGDDLRAALEASGYDEALAAGIPLALDHYGTTTAYLDAVRQLALDALAVVADERESVRPLGTAPGDAGTTSLGPLPEAVAAATPEAASPATPEASAEDVATPEAAETSTTAEDTAPTDADVEADAATATSDPADGDESATADSMPTATESESTATESADDDDTATESESASTGDDASARSADVSTDVDADARTEASGAAASRDDAADAESSETTDAGGDELDDPDDETPSDGLDDFDDETPSDGLDDFDDETSSDGLGDFEEDDLYELDEAERREVEESFDVGFESGTEVDDPGEADIDVPGPEDLDSETAADDDGQAAESPDADERDDDADAAGSDLDLETAAVETIAALDDGEGADREAVVESVVDDHGVDADAVADAIEDALLSGQCYEPSEDRLKAI